MAATAIASRGGKERERHVEVILLQKIGQVIYIHRREFTL